MMDFGGIANLPRQAPKENDIPQGMQNLIDALKATSQPVTPSGAPTVAGQLEQALNQRANPQPMGGAPMGAPQMGADMGNPQMQPMGPGVPQAAQMAAIAGQQQMAQQQAAGQQPPQPAQPMAHGGIARLRADNMARIEEYARGGIIGFDGEDESLVPSSRYPGVMSQEGATILPATTGYEGLGPLELIKALYRDATGKLKSIEQESLAASRRRAGIIDAVPSSAEPTAEQKAADAEKYKSTSLEDLIKQGASSYYYGSGDPYAERVAAAAKPVKQPTAAKPQAGERTPSAKDLLAGLDEPTTQKIFGQSKELFPENPKMKQLEAFNQQIAELQKQRPDLENEGIAALRKHEAERKALLGDQKQSDFWNKLTAYGQDLYERGGRDRLNNVIGTIDARNRADIDATLLSKQMELKLMDLAHQRKIGNVEQQHKLEKELVDLDQKRQDNIIQASNIAGHLASTVYSTKASARTHEAQLASAAAERALTRQLSAKKDQELLLARLNEDISLKSDRIREKLAKEREGEIMMAKIAADSNNPQEKAKGQQKLNDINNEIKTQVDNTIAPLVGHRSRLMLQMTGVDISQWGTPTSTPGK